MNGITVFIPAGRWYAVGDPRRDMTSLDVSGSSWTPANSFPVIDLVDSFEGARSLFREFFRGLPYNERNIRPHAGPDLVVFDIQQLEALDAFTDAGCVALGLPASFPLDDRGSEVPSRVCSQIASAAYKTNLAAILARCRMAVDPKGTGHLVYFVRGRLPHEVGRIPYRQWMIP